MTHLKTVLVQREARSVNDLIKKVGDELGHNLPFTSFSRGLLQLAILREDELLAAAREFSGLERPAHSDSKAFAEYQRKIKDLLLHAFDIRSPVHHRGADY